MLKLWGRYFPPTFALVLIFTLLPAAGQYLQDEPPPIHALYGIMTKGVVIALLSTILLSLFTAWAAGIVRRGKAARAGNSD